MRLFIDSDVVISSLLSNSGAAYFLLHQTYVKPVIASISLKEIRIVAKRMKINSNKLDSLIEDKFEVTPMAMKLLEAKKKYARYVTDINDAHIVAGAHQTKVKYLISYNLKHFKKDTIKDILDILILTPALMMQYLRSQ